MNIPRKLHIGTGRNYLPGFHNVDIFSSVHADVYADMTALPFDRGSFELIYASHVLEHAHRHMVLATLTHWRDLLAAGGVLRLAVPDFRACAEYYLRTGSLKDITGLLWGGQNHPKNNHFVGFDLQSLRESLEKVGFSDIRVWDWRETEHSRFDDYSQAHLPHMDKESGTLVSLNVEATR
jgi:predicted SAM-dependent methyltransferase